VPAINHAAGRACDGCVERWIGSALYTRSEHIARSWYAFSRALRIHRNPAAAGRDIRL